MAADTLQSYEQILGDIRSRKFAPVYLLHGEESYFIDQLADALESQVLTEAEKGFNQTVFYGKEADAGQVAAASRRFPMMSNHQLILLKEAQELKNYDALIPYFQQPLDSTVLVICYKNKKFDKRTKAFTALKKACVVFDSNKLYANQVPAWISAYLKREKVKINEKAGLLLGEYIGNNLGRIANELDKLLINKTDKSVEISLEDIEQNVGISKDFNIFELQNAIGSRNSFKAFQIAEYITQSKDFSMIPLLANLYTFFSKIYVAHHLADKSKNGLMKSLGINFFFADDYLQAMRHYPPSRIPHIFSLLKTFDLRSKGVNDTGTAEKQLLREMLCLLLQDNLA